MYGRSFGYNPGMANLEEIITDDWINRNIPGGVNSKFLVIIFKFQIR